MFYDKAIALFGIYIQEKEVLLSTKDMYKNVPCIVICNRPKLETTQTSISTEMDEYIIQWNSSLNNMHELQHVK